MNDNVKIIGAYENNLKDVSVLLHKNKITTISGVSGSGKTSLMFKVFVSEAERRTKILKGMSSEFDKYNRPGFEQLNYLNEVYAVSQKALRKSKVSNVSTVSKVNEILKDIFIEKGEITCKCGTHVENISSLETVLKLVRKKKNISFLYKIKNKNNDINNQAINLLKRFDVKTIFDASFKKLNLKKIDKYHELAIYALIDIKHIQSIENINTRKIVIMQGKEIIYDFSYQTFCHSCLTEYQIKSKSLFTKSLLSERNGRCQTCNGDGSVNLINFEDLLDVNMPLNQVFLKIPHTGKAYKHTYIQNSDIKKIVGKHNYSSTFLDLSDDLQTQLIKFLQKKIVPHSEKKEINPYIVNQKCSDCDGTGFSYKNNAIRINDKNFSECLNMTISDLCHHIQDDRLFLISKQFKNLSLSHLKLNRATSTLSGGELQRLKLVKYLSDKIENSIVVLDEPSSGLSSRDLEYLFNEIKNINDRKNTVLLIDHSDFFIKNADYNLSFGFLAGEKGGYVSDKNYEAELSYSRPLKKIDSILKFNNLTLNNLKNINVGIPLNCLTSVVGVSGSGKTSLIQEMTTKLIQLDDFQVIHANQDDVSTNLRSTIATYVGIFDELRQIFSETQRAKQLEFSPSHFSSNTPEGACNFCNGSGLFNGNTCKKCYGEKYNSKVLTIKLNGYTIREILDTPISELKKLNLSKKINLVAGIFCSLGAGYLSLGRTTSTLSGGECQRVKLSKFLLNQKLSTINKHTIIFLDEPTKGLSNYDITSVLKVIDEILNNNCTVVCVEHNSFFISNSDYIIELGPKAGELGGNIIFDDSSESYTNFKNKNIQNSSISVLQDNSLTCDSWEDDDFFRKIKYFYNNYSIKKVRNLTLYENYSSILGSLNNENIYFCPFIDDIHNNKFISKTVFNETINTLMSLGIKECLWNNNKYLLKNIRPTFNQQSYLNFFCEVTDFDLCFKLGGNSLVTLENEPHFHSLRLIDYKEKVVGAKYINPTLFNKFNCKCEYCDGSGKVLNINKVFQDFDSKITDKDFYNALKIKAVSLHNIKSSLKKFKEEMIFDLDKKIVDLSQSEINYAIYGVKEIYFLKDKARKNAISDQLWWHGLLNLINNDDFINIEKSECIMCEGTGVTKEMNYYLCEGKKIYE